ncbi:MAG: SIMPL domain-containing protein, partial [Anaerolineae bacterium]
MRKYGFVAVGVIIGLLIVGGLYALPGVLGGVAAQTATTSPAVDTSRTITVVGEGTVSAEPDQAVAMIGVEVVGDSVQEATGESADVMEALLTAFKAEGVAAADIRTSGYSVWTDYGSRSDMAGGDAEPIYRVNNIVSVTVRDLDNLGAILDAAIENGANSIQGINFTIEDKADLAAEARAEAAVDAKAKAEELAKLMGLKVGAVVSVSEVVGMAGYPVLREAAIGMGGGGGAGPISVGSLDYSSQLQVVYA